MATRQGGGLSGSIFDVAGLVSALLLAVAMILTAIGIADHAFAALLLGIAGFIPGVLTHVTGITALCGLLGCLCRQRGEQGAGSQQDKGTFLHD